MFPVEYSISSVANLNKGFAQAGDVLIPQEVSVTLRDEKGAPGARRPDITILFQILDGQLVTSSVVFSRTSLTRQVRSGDLDSINLDAIKQQVFEDLTSLYEPKGDLIKPLLDRKRGRPVVKSIVDSAEQMNVAELIAVSTVFCDPANRRRRSKAVQYQLGYSSIATANRRVREARDKGWIPDVGSTDDDYDQRYEALKGDYEQLERLMKDAK